MILLIIIALLLLSIWGHLIAKVAKIETATYGKTLLAMLIITIVVIMPVFLYNQIPGKHAFIDTSQILIFNLMPFSILLKILWGIWMVGLTSVVFYLIYRCSFDICFIISGIFYLPYVSGSMTFYFYPDFILYIYNIILFKLIYLLM